MSQDDIKTSLCYYDNFGQMKLYRDPRLIELLKNYPDMMRWKGI